MDAFRVDTSTATLTTLTGSPFELLPAGYFPHMIIADSLGRFLYLIDGGPSVRSFRVDGSTGTLALTGVVANRAANLLVPHPNGKTVYVVQNGDAAGRAGSIQSYAVAQASGTLAPGPTISLPPPYSSVSFAMVDPSGRYLFASGRRTLDPYDQGTSVVTYAIDASTGALTRTQTYTATPYGGMGPKGMAVSRDFVFLAVDSIPTLQVARITADGSLLQVYDSTFAEPGLHPEALIISEQGNLMYFKNAVSNAIESWSVDSSGTPHLISQILVGFPLSVSELLLTKDGRTLFVMDSYRTIYAHAVDSAGKVGPATGTPYTTTDPQQWINMVLVE